MDIVIITKKEKFWEELCEPMEKCSTRITIADSLDMGLAVIQVRQPALVVFDLDMDVEPLRTAVIDVLKINAMIHTAAVTDMTEEVFHETMEGLGMLMSLPCPPSSAHIEELMKVLMSHMPA